MGVSQGSTSLALEDILKKVSEMQILKHFLGVSELPTVINSPLREDNNPSFGLYTPDGKRVRYKDFATGDTGSLFTLLEKKWGLSFQQVLTKIINTNIDSSNNVVVSVTKYSKSTTTYSGNTNLEVKIRDWRDYDIEYWNNYGISLDLLKEANVFPISHYIITKNNRRMIFGADRLAFAYFECKEGIVSIKVYQPYNKHHFKWISKHDRSVLGLWHMIPSKGKVVCICSSVKDALCLRAATNIPTICLQGEAYGISQTAQQVLRSRFDNVCILLDSDKPGKEDANKLAEQTGFINIELPESKEYKDIAEYYTFLNNPKLFKTNLINLFKQKIV